ncbi:MAG: RagB/SusD family nutrient uptake outer membrane protein [Bacteroidetes bacterium]|uniref:RagB/SusD family nutrient uptake outer membrane protein n=1 Tax=Candidatus Cryptobacteroides excrementipullorum TaxID=2840761 RepID=A0A9D9IUI1_9BACT|nr:RagB/SusD family nutrient uptake outer membrane protein [Candidatus Cryptobacteroides excrementipullorum]
MKNKILIIFGAAAALAAVSCSDFLKENPKTFLSPDTYFTTEDQMKAAVGGLYTFLDDIFDGDVEVGTQRFIFLEYMTGYGERKRSAGGIYTVDQPKLLTVTEENTNLEALWRTAYTAIENANVAIAGISSSSTEISDASRNNLLGQAYFMRAYHYFNLVRLWGDVPLKTAPTTDMSNTEIPLTAVADVYTQIVADLTAAEGLIGTEWNNSNGYVALSAVKALLAKVYMTMAGFPLQLGKEYYDLAYAKAKEVYDNAGISLYSTFDEMRNAGFVCGGENILTIEREADKASSPVHTALLPYPELAGISDNSAYGGAIAPTASFYESYSDSDLRKADFGYYTCNYNALDGSGLIAADSPYIYKYWDQNAATNAGKSAMGYPLIRYADVLLLMAEAKVMSDGGSTSDAAAIDAYMRVHSRALPDEAAPASLDFATVYKERIWELCFETQTWYDMLRTRKALNTTTGEVVDLIGYQTPGHEAAFEEDDLLFPYPLREKRLNPNLVRK